MKEIAKIFLSILLLTALLCAPAYASEPSSPTSMAEAIAARDAEALQTLYNQKIAHTFKNAAGDVVTVAAMGDDITCTLDFTAADAALTEAAAACGVTVERDIDSFSVSAETGFAMQGYSANLDTEAGYSCTLEDIGAYDRYVISLRILFTIDDTTYADAYGIHHITLNVAAGDPPRIAQTHTSYQQDGTTSVIIFANGATEYALAVYKDGELLTSKDWQTGNSFTLTLSQDGEYVLRGMARNAALAEAEPVDSEPIPVGDYMIYVDALQSGEYWRAAECLAKSAEIAVTDGGGQVVTETAVGNTIRFAYTLDDSLLKQAAEAQNHTVRYDVEQSVIVGTGAYKRETDQTTAQGNTVTLAAVPVCDTVQTRLIVKLYMDDSNIPSVGQYDLASVSVAAAETPMIGHVSIEEYYSDLELLGRTAIVYGNGGTAYSGWLYKDGQPYQEFDWQEDNAFLLGKQTEDGTYFLRVKSRNAAGTESAAVDSDEFIVGDLARMIAAIKRDDYNDLMRIVLQGSTVSSLTDASGAPVTQTAIGDTLRFTYTTNADLIAQAAQACGVTIDYTVSPVFLANSGDTMLSIEQNVTVTGNTAQLSAVPVADLIIPRLEVMLEYGGSMWSCMDGDSIAVESSDPPLVGVVNFYMTGDDNWNATAMTNGANEVLFTLYKDGAALRNSGWQTINMFDFGAIEADGEYFVRVTARNAAETESASVDSESFDIGTLPELIEALSNGNYYEAASIFASSAALTPFTDGSGAEVTEATVGQEIHFSYTLDDTLLTRAAEACGLEITCISKPMFTLNSNSYGITINADSVTGNTGTLNAVPAYDEICKGVNVKLTIDDNVYARNYYSPGISITPLAVPRIAKIEYWSDGQTTEAIIYGNGASEFSLSIYKDGLLYDDMDWQTGSHFTLDTPQEDGTYFLRAKSRNAGRTESEPFDSETFIIGDLARMIDAIGREDYNELMNVVVQGSTAASFTDASGAPVTQAAIGDTLRFTYTTNADLIAQAAQACGVTIECTVTPGFMAQSGDTMVSIRQNVTMTGNTAELNGVPVAESIKSILNVRLACGNSVMGSRLNCTLIGIEASDPPLVGAVSLYEMGDDNWYATALTNGASEVLFTLYKDGAALRNSGWQVSREYVVGAIEEDGEYFVRVKARNAAETESAAVDSESFDIGTLPELIEALSNGDYYDAANIFASSAAFTPFTDGSGAEVTEATVGQEIRFSYALNDTLLTRAAEACGLEITYTAKPMFTLNSNANGVTINADSVTGNTGTLNALPAYDEICKGVYVELKIDAYLYGKTYYGPGIPIAPLAVPKIAELTYWKGAQHIDAVVYGNGASECSISIYKKDGQLYQDFGWQTGGRFTLDTPQEDGIYFLRAKLRNGAGTESAAVDSETFGVGSVAYIINALENNDYDMVADELAETAQFSSIMDESGAALTETAVGQTIHFSYTLNDDALEQAAEACGLEISYTATPAFVLTTSVISRWADADSVEGNTATLSSVPAYEKIKPALSVDVTIGSSMGNSGCTGEYIPIAAEAVPVIALVEYWLEGEPGEEHYEAVVHANGATEYKLATYKNGELYQTSDWHMDDNLFLLSKLTDGEYFFRGMAKNAAGDEAVPVDSEPLVIGPAADMIEALNNDEYYRAAYLFARTAQFSSILDESGMALTEAAVGQAIHFSYTLNDDALDRAAEACGLEISYTATPEFVLRTGSIYNYVKADSVTGNTAYLDSLPAYGRVMPGVRLLLTINDSMYEASSSGTDIPIAAGAVPVIGFVDYWIEYDNDGEHYEAAVHGNGATQYSLQVYRDDLLLNSFDWQTSNLFVLGELTDGVYSLRGMAKNAAGDEAVPLDSEPFSIGASAEIAEALNRGNYWEAVTLIADTATYSAFMDKDGNEITQADIGQTVKFSYALNDAQIAKAIEQSGVTAAYTAEPMFFAETCGRNVWFQPDSVQDGTATLLSVPVYDRVAQGIYIELSVDGEVYSSGYFTGSIPIKAGEKPIITKIETWELYEEKETCVVVYGNGATEYSLSVTRNGQAFYSSGWQADNEFNIGVLEDGAYKLRVVSRSAAGAESDAMEDEIMLGDQLQYLELLQAQNYQALIELVASNAQLSGLTDESGNVLTQAVVGQTVRFSYTFDETPLMEAASLCGIDIELSYTPTFAFGTADVGLYTCSADAVEGAVATYRSVPAAELAGIALEISLLVDGETFSYTQGGEDVSIKAAETPAISSIRVMRTKNNTWNATVIANGATGYHYRLYKDGEEYKAYGWLSTSKANLGELEEPGDYYLEVRAKNAAGIRSEYAYSWHFTVTSGSELRARMIDLINAGEYEALTQLYVDNLQIIVVNGSNRVVSSFGVGDVIRFGAIINARNLLSEAAGQCGVTFTVRTFANFMGSTGGCSYEIYTPSDAIVPAVEEIAAYADVTLSITDADGEHEHTKRVFDTWYPVLSDVPAIESVNIWKQQDGSYNAVVFAAGAESYHYRVYKDGKVLKTIGWRNDSVCPLDELTEPGTYYVEVRARDASGGRSDYVNSDVLTLTSDDLPLTLDAVLVNGEDAALTCTVADAVLFEAQGRNGVGEISYRFLIQRLENHEWMTDTTVEWQSDPTYEARFSTPGVYRALCTLLDQADTFSDDVCSQSVTVENIAPPTLDNVTSALTVATVGQENAWTAQATGGALPLNYHYRLYRDGLMYKTIGWLTDPTCAFTFTEPGVYKMQVRVRDANDARSDYVMSDEITVAPPPPSIIAVTGESAEREVGQENAWTAIVTGGDGELNYHFRLYKDGVKPENVYRTFGWQADPSCAFTFTEPGEYRMQVRARDEKDNRSDYFMSDPVTVVSASPVLTGVTASAASAYIGQSGEWTASVTGGEGELTYQFTLYKDGAAYDAIDHTTDAVYAFAFTESGVYVLKATAWDELNRRTETVSSADMTVTQEPPVLTAVVSAQTAATIGQENTWTAQATGGASPLSYHFRLYKDGVKSENVYRTFGWLTVPSCAFTFTEPGVYTMQVRVRDANDARSDYVMSNEITVTPPPPSIIAVTGENAEREVGQENAWTSEVTGGAGELNYHFRLYKDGVKSENVYRTFGWLTVPSCAFTFTEPGEYRMQVRARDEKGNRSDYFMSDPVTVVPASPVLTSVDSLSTALAPGQVNTWTPQVAGGSGVLSYSYTLFKDGAEYSAFGWLTDERCTVKLTQAGEYVMRVQARDDMGRLTETVDSAAVTVAQEPPTLLSVTSLNATFKTGQSNTWTAEVTGGAGALQYHYRLYNGNGTVSETFGWQNSPSFSCVISKAGAYYMEVRVKDSLGTRSAYVKSATVTVTTAGPELSVTSRYAGPRTVGQANRWYANATGGVPALQYHFRLYKDGAAYRTFGWQSGAQYVFTFTEPGTYYMEVRVKDANNARSNYANSPAIVITK